jgi:hypothetical protein
VGLRQLRLYRRYPLLRPIQFSRSNLFTKLLVHAHYAPVRHTLVISALHPPADCPVLDMVRVTGTESREILKLNVFNTQDNPTLAGVSSSTGALCLGKLSTLSSPEVSGLEFVEVWINNPNLGDDNY